MSTVDLASAPCSSPPRRSVSSLELAPGELLAAATREGARLQGITAVLLLTRENDFNALAATMLEGTVDGPVYRLAPPGDRQGVVAPYSGSAVLFPATNRATVDSRYADGLSWWPAPPVRCRTGRDVLIVVHDDGRLEPATGTGPLAPHGGDTLVLLAGGRPDSRSRRQARSSTVGDA